MGMDAEALPVSMTNVNWRSFEICFNHRKTKFIVVRYSGDSEHLGASGAPIMGLKKFVCWPVARKTAAA